MLAGRITVGFPRMHREPSERRDFLPPLIGLLAANGAEVHVETGIGSGMGYTDLDYTHGVAGRAHHRRGRLLPPGHRRGAARARGPLPPAAARRGARLDAPLRDPARHASAMLQRARASTRSASTWSRNDGRPAAGREPAQRRVERRRRRVRRARADAGPTCADPHRSTVKVTIMGAGRVGRHAVEFATKYGDDARNEAFGRDRAAGRRGRHRRPQPHRGRRYLQGPPGR